MTTSPLFGLPFVSNQQAQPEVTLNRSLMMLQALQSGAEGRQNAPPGAPTDGKVWIVGSAPTGAWAGRANKIAIYYGGWLFVPGVDSDGLQIPMGAAQEGWRIYNKSTDELLIWSGAAWNSYLGAVSGAWTPVDASGVGLAFSVYSSTYIKIGNLVFVSANLDYPTTTDTANAVIGGLPFASNSIIRGYTYTASKMFGLENNGSGTNLAITDPGVAYAKNAEVSGTNFSFSASYMTL